MRTRPETGRDDETLIDDDESSEAVEEMVVRRVAAFVMAGGLAWGLDLGAVSGALPGVRRRFELTANETGLFVSLAGPGEILGAGIGGLVGDVFGRKACLKLCDAAFLVSSLVLATAQGKEQLFCGRFGAGVAAGTAIVAQIAYASEVAPAKRRGQATASSAEIKFKFRYSAT